MDLRILTVNVQNSEGGPAATAAVNRGIRELAPDLVALQEVVDRGQLDELLDGTGLHGTHQSDVALTELPGTDRYGGSAVASRRPHRIVEVLDPRTAGSPDVPWATLAAIVELPVGEVLFIATTAAWRLAAEATRVRQAVALTDLDARHRTTLPTIIAGDLNAAPESASVRYLTGLQPVDGRSVCYHDAWAVLGDGPGHTWTVDNPEAARVIDQIVGQPNHRRRIDYVLVGSWDAHPEAYCRIRSAALAFDRPADGTHVSDHLGVVVDADIGTR